LYLLALDNKIRYRGGSLRFALARLDRLGTVR